MKSLPKDKIIYIWNSGQIAMRIFLLVMSFCFIWSIYNNKAILLVYIIPMILLVSWKYSSVIITDEAITKLHYFRPYNRKFIIPLSHIKKFEIGWSRYESDVYRLTYFTKKRNGRFSLKDEESFQFIVKKQNDFERIVELFKSKKIKVSATYPWYKDRMYSDLE